MPPRNSSSDVLPPELWLIIFEFVLTSGVDLVDRPNHLNFPTISEELRSPWSHPPRGIPALRNLRLVCRTFNSLLRSSPYLILKKRDTPITPNAARAVYISPCGEAKAYLERLLAEHLFSQRIVILDIPGREYRNSPVPMVFDFLCENSHLLPGVRSLALGLHHYTSVAPTTPKFWRRLNDAFPHLVCLTLRGSLKTAMEDPVEPPVVFKNLEILDHDTLSSDPNVYFPILCHVAFNSIIPYQLQRFTGLRSLRSLLARKSFYVGRIFEWDFFPGIKLLGIPGEHVYELSRLPPGHPLEHLYVYIGTVSRNDHYHDPDRKAKELAWMKEITERLPTISQITFAYPLPSEYLSSAVWGDFDEDELGILGLERVYCPELGRSESRDAVFRRVGAMHQETLLTVTSRGFFEIAEHAKGFRADWNSFLLSASHKLRLRQD